MGTAVSKNLDLSNNEYCMKFVAEEPISPNDPFWNRFLSFNVSPPTTTDDQLFLESRLEALFQIFLKNNLKSGNFSTLIQLFVLRSSELLAATNSNANLFNWQVYNTLFAIRCVVKFLIETVTEEQLIEHVEFGNGSSLESFIGTLVGVIVDVPINDSTYVIHLESVTCLLILLSVQFHSGQRSDQSTVYRLIMKGKHTMHAPVLVKCLLLNFINQLKPPPGFGGTQGQSLVIDNNPIPPTEVSSVFKIDFNALYLTLCKKTSGDIATLLLYLLLHRNQSFKSFLLSRMDLDQLIIPILKTLYNAPSSNSHHIYMSLIILLILSEDEGFNKMIHETEYNFDPFLSEKYQKYKEDVQQQLGKLKNVTWYTERAFTEVSLGGLLILVVIRIVQYNMLKMRDKYLHTNCLAALANMSSQFRELHPYVSQRLISLFETIAKKYQRLITWLQNDKDTKNNQVAVTVSQDVADMEQDLNVLEEVLRMVLEILNSALSTQLISNPNLIYTLLYKKHIFEPFRDNVVFQDIIYNIDIIIKYFSQLLSEKSQQHEVDAYQVLSVIQQGAKHWPKEKLTKFPDLKFKYVEEDQPEEFFIPYVWELVSQYSVLHWSSNTSSVLSAVC